MHKVTELFDHTYLIFKLLNFTTESSINCDNFVQDLHTTKVTFVFVLFFKKRTTLWI